MGQPRPSRVNRHSLADVLAMMLAILGISCAVAISVCLLPQDSKILMPITERLGTTAGLVSALSLAGLTFAGAGGRAGVIFARFSKTLALFFAGSYFVVVMLALICALAPAWELHTKFISAVIGATIGFMVVVVAGTTFVLFGLLHQSTIAPNKPTEEKKFTPDYLSSDK